MISMKTETEEKDVCHPNGKILLRNGIVLDCYPKESQPANIVPDAVGLDMCGEFLQIKGGSKKRSHYRKKVWKELFFQEAFFLYERREKILEDSRMFLTPIPFENNLAYSGTSGLRNATLGVYLEWWDECEHAVIKMDDQVQALTYFIAGSPLSGGNHCSAVDRKGETITIQFSPFLPIWSSFMRINQRYDEAKRIYQGYTLEETISKLRYRL